MAKPGKNIRDLKANRVAASADMPFFRNRDRKIAASLREQEQRGVLLGKAKEAIRASRRKSRK